MTKKRKLLVVCVAAIAVLMASVAYSPDQQPEQPSCRSGTDLLYVGEETKRDPSGQLLWSDKMKQLEDEVTARCQAHQAKTEPIQYLSLIHI